ncbi:hypothetical protein [Quadrisphaera sp. DSM 44207]|uniref:hypothetical protein n=1 Tax=Quadrisphaera sp. DSM 44207 TaxID=1881057 RepID=UPI000887A4B9|nr:hypothetical protein [Quadrisphaera sp. DSM 44207]SDQ67754.1 hypothetical protein SAMN05428996_2348 [Quadrisphaera sp. DSM 44207]
MPRIAERAAAPGAALAAALREAHRTRSLHLLVLLLLPIPFLLVAHQLYFWDVGPFTSPRWAVNSDRSFIEVLGYAQLAAAAVLLLLRGLRQRGGLAYVGWAVALTVVALDDALRWHEAGGAWLTRRQLVPEVLSLPQQALGELVTWVLLGVPVLLLLAVTHLASSPSVRRDSWLLAALMGVLMLFGAGVDILHEGIEEVTDNSVVDLLVTFVEAGGELGAMTALLACAVHVWRR